MGLGTAHVRVGETKTAGFVPALWSDEIQATYKKNLVIANHVKKMSMVGKKGDTIYVPKPVRGSASQKSLTAQAQVTLIAESGSSLSVSIDQHWEYSRLIEDITDIQSKTSLRRFYTDDAGYALAKQVDTFLGALASSWQGGGGTATFNKAVKGDDGSTLYTSGAPNAANLADVGIRKVIQTLDESDVPSDGRVLVIPPSQANILRGLARYTEQAFVGEGGSSNTIRTGRIGNVYGVEVFVSTNVPVATGSAKIAMLFHPEATVFVEQMAPRVQTQYKQEYLGDLMTADTIFGGKVYRDYAGVAIAVP